MLCLLMMESMIALGIQRSEMVAMTNALNLNGVAIIFQERLVAEMLQLIFIVFLDELEWIYDLISVDSFSSQHSLSSLLKPFSLSLSLSLFLSLSFLIPFSFLAFPPQLSF